MEDRNLDDNPMPSELESDKLEHIENVVEPQVGMIFDTYGDLLQYYESYAKQEGFAVFQRSITNAENGEKRYKTLTCNREGQKSSRSKNEFRLKPVSGTKRKARLNVIIGPEENCVINSLCLEHNHSLSPNKSRFFRSNRVINSHIKKKLEMNDIAGIRPNKSYRSIVVEAGGHENVPFLEKDCRNFLDKVRRLRLGEGDANAINNYFLKMQADNSKFLYVMDLDEKGRLRNIFWAQKADEIGSQQPIQLQRNQTTQNWSQTMSFSEILQPTSSYAEIASYGYVDVSEAVQQLQTPEHQLNATFGPKPGDHGYMSYSHIQQRNNYRNNQLTSSSKMIPSESTLNHPYNELFEHLISKGYREDQIVTVIQNLEKSGRQVNFKDVVDLLNTLSY